MIDGRRYGIIRSPTGFLPESQGHGVLSLPCWFHFTESARAYLFHPLTLLDWVNLMIGPHAFQATSFQDRTDVPIEVAGESGVASEVRSTWGESIRERGR